jgi:S-adenosylmethionine hydrolase
MRVPAGPIITLTTDFGLTDAYVAAMKGVILSIAPGAQIVDVSHDVEPQNIREAGFLLESVLPHFPEGTAHVVVVDPGVGTERLPIAMRLPGAYLVGPDNGVLPASLARLGLVDPCSGAVSAPAEAVELRNRELFSGTVSATFHGRDIFAPVAAHLASGTPLSTLGPSLQRLVTLPAQHPLQEETLIRGEVIHVDHFGNLITNIRGEDVPRSIAVEIGGAVVQGLVRTYQERELAALVGSTGYVEIAERNGNAARRLRAHVGAAVCIRPAP